MNSTLVRNAKVAFLSLLLLLLPAIVLAQTETTNPGPPPIAQQMVRADRHILLFYRYLLGNFT